MALHSIDVILKLSPSGVDLRRIRCDGGLPGITAEDAATVMSYLSRPASMFIRAKYLTSTPAEVASCAAFLYSAMFDAIRPTAVANGWRFDKVDEMIAVCIQDELYPSLCAACGGGGADKHGDEGARCDVCEGTGQKIKPVTDVAAIAKRLGVKERQFHNVYRKQLGQIRELIQGYEAELYQAVNRLG